MTRFPWIGKISFPKRWKIPSLLNSCSSHILPLINLPITLSLVDLCWALPVRHQQEQRQQEQKGNGKQRKCTNCFFYSVPFVGLDCPPSLLGVTVVQWPPLEGSTSSTCLVSAAESLPSSISESSPDSAEHDSSSDSSLFPNKLPSFLHTSIRGALSLWSRNFPVHCCSGGTAALPTGSLCQLGRPSNHIL